MPQRGAVSNKIFFIISLLSWLIIVAIYTAVVYYQRIAPYKKVVVRLVRGKCILGMFCGNKSGWWKCWRQSRQGDFYCCVTLLETAPPHPLGCDPKRDETKHSLEIFFLQIACLSGLLKQAGKPESLKTELHSLWLLLVLSYYCHNWCDVVATGQTPNRNHNCCDVAKCWTCSIDVIATSYFNLDVAIYFSVSAILLNSNYICRFS